MGMFTSNRFGSLAGSNFVELDIPANESYNDITGCGIAVIENVENDYRLFEAAISGDFAEVAAVQEGYQVINEGAKDVLDKIKEVFKKLLAKIKGILQAFLAKILGQVSSGDKLYNRYLKTITSHSDWEGFKVKNYRKPKGGSSKDVTKTINDVDYDMTAFSYCAINDPKNLFDAFKDVSKNPKKDGDVENADWKRIEIIQKLDLDSTKIFDNSNGYDTDELTEKVVKARCSALAPEIDKLTDFDKAYMDYVFEDPETEDSWDSSEINSTNIGMLLHKNSGKKFKQGIEECNKKLTGLISKIVHELEKWQKEAVDKVAKNSKDSRSTEKFDARTLSITGSKYEKNGAQSYSKSNMNSGNLNLDNYYNKDAYAKKKKESSKVGYLDASGNEVQDLDNKKWKDRSTKAGQSLIKWISFLQRVASIEQNAISHYTSARLKTTKFALSQAHRVWASAAAYASRKHESVDYDYYTAVGEAAQYDFDSDMEELSA